MLTIDDVRPEVKQFAIAMEEILRDNDYKGGWDRCSEEYLKMKFAEEVCEVCEAFEYQKYEDIMHEVVDVSNVCMMLYEYADRILKR
jgi:NTP pyrophosphatase (non-canonical NTP hydrolase)